MNRPTASDYSDYISLSVSKNRYVAFITFDYGEINILDITSVGELVRLAEQLENDDEVKVIVFQSANPEYFMSHAHFPLLQQFRDEGAYDTDDMPLYSGLLEQFRTMPKATIGKIEGRARGGGAEFVMAMDMSFGAIDKAYLSQMEIIMGILPGGGAAQYLARKVGRCRAMEICLSGEDYSAINAERYGYINRALPANEITNYVEELAYRIASYSAESIALNKAAVNLDEDKKSNDFVDNNRLFRELVKAPAFDNRVTKFLRNGGETSAREMKNWREWAKELC